MTFTATDVTTTADAVVDDNQPFFAPTSFDLIDRLIGEYQRHRRNIDSIAAIATGEMASAIHYFVAANKSREQTMPSVAQLFEPTGAIFQLNAAYWAKAMNLTDVYDAMPQARRDYWNAQLNGEQTITQGCTTIDLPPLPDFEEQIVRDTLSDLLNSRAKFMAERVDGIFQALSGKHVTNCPEAFGKRMIIANVNDQYGHTSHTRAGHIADLRAVIAKFMGRAGDAWTATTHIVQTARNRPGEWVTLDGGALRLKCFMVGTAHLEIHPHMAYRLNQVLAALHPNAIPAKFRQKPAQLDKEFQLIKRPLPFAVLEILADAEQLYELQLPVTWKQKYIKIENGITLGYRSDNKAALLEVRRILVSIGGVQYGKSDRNFQFEYPVLDVIRDIVASGCIPDQKSHQFHPTPTSVGSVAIEMAAIGDQDTCLEPSAGQGDLAALMPIDRTVCVEISELRCSILKARGFNTVQADFIEWAKTAAKVDVVVMNPPFSEGRAQRHVEVAAGLVNKGGRLVAVLPASLKGSDILPGWDVQWSGVFSNEFAGTTVSVVIVRGVKP